MIITTLVENTQHNHDTDLRPEPGLSLHVSFAGMQILFDKGISEAFSCNASRLGVDLGAVQTAVLSHHHFDHGGGLPRFIELNSDAKVHLRKPPDGEPYFKGLLVMRKRVGLEAGLLESCIDRFAIVHEPIRISDDVHLVAIIRGPHPQPAGNRHLYLRTKSGWLSDDFSHELCMVIRQNGKLVVLTGCSHSGILNMIETVASHLNGVPIRAVIGGFHQITLPIFNSMAGRRRQVEALGRQLLSLPVDCYYTGHCTGRKAYGGLQPAMGERLQPLHNGTVIEL